MKKRLVMMASAFAAATGTTLSAKADAVRVYDVDDYVQDGLVTHFDAIDNVFVLL